jgi:uncharacterized protein (TIGR01777 family)
MDTVISVITEMTATSVLSAATSTPATAPARIVLAGGTGQIGSLLARHFHTSGHQVCVLARTTLSAPWPMAAWDGEQLGAWVASLEGTDVLINLAGRSVNCRYNHRNRRDILQSRVRSTELLGRAISKLDQPPRLWLNASTATIYRHSLDRAMGEDGELGGREPGVPPEWHFSIEVAKQWEEAFFAAHTPATRKVALRSAMTMSPDSDGIFDTLLRLVRLGLGGKAGSGRQYVSWIHERDFIRALEFLIACDTIEGVVNVSSPHPLPNTEFMQILREAWGIRYGLAASAWMLEVGALLMQTETELILKSRRVVPARLLDLGFQLEFPHWPEAARNLVSQWRMRNAKKESQ